MRITLHYRGQLRANGSPDHKHTLRKVFHRQLLTLWQQRPLTDNPGLLKERERDGEYSLLRHRESFTFVPLITAEMDVVGELSIVLLRPEPPEKLLTQGGDIDNRLKPLFDALTMPRHGNSLPSGATPAVDESPFYCLLEDDNLVISVAVRTEQLLEPEIDPSEVDAVIHIRTRVTRATWGNGMFA